MTFREFWPCYLQAHSRPATRAVHYSATLLGLASTLAAAIVREPLFLLGIGVAYGAAIGSHALIEKNRSMIRVNPVWGALADLSMFWLAATGGLEREIARCNARSDPRRRTDSAIPMTGTARRSAR